MTFSGYLVQVRRDPDIKNDTPIPSEDASAFLERLSEHNWLRPNSKRPCTLAVIDALCIYTEKQLRTVIPVGSVEFVQAVMDRAYHIPHLKPYHIPEQLQCERFLHRRITTVPRMADVPRIFHDWKEDKLFLKSADCVKCDYTDIYEMGGKLPDASGSVFASQCLDFQSEWRAFVWRGKLVDIRNYEGDPWLMPDRQSVEAMIAAIGEAIPAYTLDVGVSPEGTSVIEVHNFIACGTYGAVVPLSMYGAAYLHEIQRAGAK